MDSQHAEREPSSEKPSVADGAGAEAGSGELNRRDVQEALAAEAEMSAVDPASEESYDPFDDPSSPRPPAFEPAPPHQRRAPRHPAEASEEENALFEAELERIRTELMGLDAWKGDAELDDSIAKGIPLALGGKGDDGAARAERWGEASKRLMFLGFVACVASSLFPWMEPRFGEARPPIATFGDFAFFLPLGLAAVAAAAWALGRPLVSACVSLGWGSFALIGAAQFLFAITLVESTSNPALGRLLALSPAPGWGLWAGLVGGALLVWAGALLSGSLLPADRKTLNASPTGRLGLALVAAMQGLGLGLALGWASFSSLPSEDNGGPGLREMAERPRAAATPSPAASAAEQPANDVPTVSLGQTIRVGGLAFTPLRVEKRKIAGFQAGASFETEEPLLVLRAKLRNITEGEFFIPSPPRLLAWAHGEDQYGNRVAAVAPDPLTREPIYDGQFTGELAPGEEVDAVFLTRPPRLDAAVNHSWTLAFVASTRDAFDLAAPPPSRTARVAFTKFHIADAPLEPLAPTPAPTPRALAIATPRPTPTPFPTAADRQVVKLKARAWLESEEGEFVELPAGSSLRVERTESIAGRTLYFGGATAPNGAELGEGWLRETPPPEPPKFATPREARLAEHLAFGQPKLLDPEVAARSTLIVREAFVLQYDEELNAPLWAACRLDQEDIFSPIEIEGRRNYRQDDAVKARLSPPASYRGTGYELAPLVPPENARKSFGALADTLYLTNFAPQRAGLRRGPWNDLNVRAREWARQRRQVWVYCGVAFEPKKAVEMVNNVAAPDYYWMVLVDEKPGGALSAIGFLMPNADEGLSSFVDYRAPIETIERLAGVDLFAGMPEDAARDLRATSLVEWESR